MASTRNVYAREWKRIIENPQVRIWIVKASNDPDDQYAFTTARDSIEIAPRIVPPGTTDENYTERAQLITPDGIFILGETARGALHCSVTSNVSITRMTPAKI